MNRTLTFLVTASALGLIALVARIPGPRAAPPAPTVVAPAPAPAPKPPDPASTPGSLRLSGRLSHPYVTVGQSDVFLNVEVSGVTVPGAQRAPVNLALVIDRSGSMAGQKLAQARRAAAHLVDQLTSADRLSIIHYGSDVRVRPGAFATLEEKARMKAFIARIQDEGGTNIGEGLMAGRAQLALAGGFDVNRVILVSDGQPTVGVTSQGGLMRVAQRIRGEGYSITSLGVGLDFNEDLMQRFAEVGGGSYGYLRDASAMASILQKDLQQASTTVARNVTLRLRLPEGALHAEVLGRPSTTLGRTLEVPLPDFSAGQVERFVVRVRAEAQAGAPAVDVAQLELGYQDVLANRAADATLKLAAAVTADPSLARAQADKDTLVLATRATNAVQLRRAAEAFERGDAPRARREMEQAQRNLDDLATTVGDQALEFDRLQVNQAVGAVTAAPAASPEVQADLVKSFKRESLKGAGYGVSAY